MDVTYALLCLATVTSLLSPARGHGRAASDLDYGVDLINDLLTNDPETLCKYVQCVNPVDEEACPEGTFFMAGIAQFGCCGACVQFRGLGDPCTGSIHPEYCGGYGLYGQDGDCSDPWRKLRNLRNSIEENLYMQDNVVRSSWCGYNIACGRGRKCEIDSTAKGCVYIQRKYDEARQPGSELYLDYRDDYRWRPTCSNEGFFTEKQCKGPPGEQRCVCVDPDGNRLYGDAYPYQEELYDSMNCKCSRRVWELQQAGEKSVTLHCAANGNYERLQCEDGWCYCIDPESATPYGSRLPEGAMDRLDCYNKTLVGSQYLRRCESEYHAHMELYELMAFKGVQGPSTLLNCDADGSYAGMQCTIGSCRCYDKAMNIIISGLAGSGCQCARDKWMSQQLNINIEISCDVDSGSYKSVQTRAEYAFCVDSDGVRAGPLVYQSAAGNLGCGAALSCQNGGDYKNCENACQGCSRDDYVK
ncbi:uncharacterized protein LOC125025967 [Penaeus chinensis]|uniref:uncharacterized protein LOC125025967 n=1 Tax=Penaeus chinensis TaxID=139456 RepID=UPI001FB7FB70|nr:uncharacterized protein LOC125025967 [Penaeus chinensis]XP_047470294.1 uncharacterized protein LOC125025967 [Penaeus chinensis]XP_047470301.1 uncharacterized protein LOC125025967 [Penaeus chinensis]